MALNLLAGAIPGSVREQGRRYFRFSSSDFSLAIYAANTAK